MSPERQRIVIAEACGYYKVEGTSYYLNKNSQKILRDLPDYLNDLNAMYQAEETLDASQCAEYARQLSKYHPTYCVSVLDGRDELEDVAYETFQIIHATAAERAEAFLHTIGKWEK